MTGGSGSDYFVLGDEKVFYNDGNNSSSGLKDYAIITDFNSKVDYIQLVGNSRDYVLGQVDGIKQGMCIFLDTNINGKFDSKDELVAVIEGYSDLNLKSSSFIYV